MNDRSTLLHRLSDAAWRTLLIGAVLVILLWALAYIKVVTIPIILAVFLTALLMPSTNRLRRLGLGRGTSTAVAFLGALILLAGVMTLIVQPAVAGFPGLVESLQQAPDSLRTTFTGLGVDPVLLDDTIDQATAEILQAIEQNRQQLVTGVWTAGAAAAEVLVGIILVLVLTVYFVHSGDTLMQWCSTLLPGSSRAGMRATADTAYGVVGRYIRGVAWVGLIDAIGIGVPLLFLIEPGLAVPLIVLTFLGAFVPIVGAFLTGLLAVLVALVTEGLVTALIVIGVVLLVQQLESHVFAPRVYGKALDLPGAVVLVSVSAGAVVGGILGMFLATPVVAVVAGLLRDRPFAVAEQAGEHRAEQDGEDSGGGRPAAEKTGAAPAKAGARGSSPAGRAAGGGKGRNGKASGPAEGEADGPAARD
ncbi:AI-2E family transporter [Nocardiopsis potens]|uniref:AI-2E family transporter n=1 Tax=Nocardiopsis potens TaxID=1246458 RepID=UPI0003468049|nr:AI-2E family transporter [Nocardiopsis potens]